jgi:serine/threonine protein kinase
MQQYRLQGSLGAGAFGEVTRAMHLPSGRVVALKRVYAREPPRGSAWERAQLEPQARRHDAPTTRLSASPACAVERSDVHRERRCLARCAHENIVRLLEWFEHEGCLVLVLEFVRTDLGAVLRSRRRLLPVASVRVVLRGVLRGLAHMHEAARVMHRDVKPSNVLLQPPPGVDSDGDETDMFGAGCRIALGDFGLARPLEGGEGSLLYTQQVQSRWYRGASSNAPPSIAERGGSCAFTEPTARSSHYLLPQRSPRLRLQRPRSSLAPAPTARGWTSGPSAACWASCWRAARSFRARRTSSSSRASCRCLAAPRRKGGRCVNG